MGWPSLLGFCWENDKTLLAKGSWVLTWSRADPRAVSWREVLGGTVARLAQEMGIVVPAKDPLNSVNDLATAWRGRQEREDGGARGMRKVVFDLLLAGLHRSAVKSEKINQRFSFPGSGRVAGWARFQQSVAIVCSISNRFVYVAWRGYVVASSLGGRGNLSWSQDRLPVVINSSFYPL